MVAPGRQAAKGARLGILGATSIVDAPVHVNACTRELAEDWSALSLQDVLENDAAVVFTTSKGHLLQNFNLRGLDVTCCRSCPCRQAFRPGKTPGPALQWGLRIGRPGRVAGEGHRLLFGTRAIVTGADGSTRGAIYKVHSESERRTAEAGTPRCARRRGDKSMTKTGMPDGKP